MRRRLRNRPFGWCTRSVRGCRRADHGSADGMWTLAAVQRALAPMSGTDPAAAGFACEATLPLATETIGFSQ